MKENLYRQIIRGNRRTIRIMAVVIAIIGALSLVLYACIVRQGQVVTEQEKIIEEYEQNMTGATFRLVQLETELESRNRSGI